MMNAKDKKVTKRTDGFTGMEMIDNRFVWTGTITEWMQAAMDEYYSQAPIDGISVSITVYCITKSGLFYFPKSRKGILQISSITRHLRHVIESRKNNK